MKKYLLLFLPLLSLSQDLQISKDEFNNFKKIQCTTQKQNAVLAGSITKDLSLTFTFYANISENGNKFMYMSANIYTTSLLCYSDYDGKLIMLFENGDKITLKQISKTSCNTTSIISYQLEESDLVILLNHDIKKVRIYTTQNYLEGTIKESKLELIKETLIKFRLNIN